MKLKQMVQGLLYISALAGAAQVMAADLNVAGRIQPSGACSLALGNGGVVDLGTLTSRNLARDGYREFYRQISLSIDCQTPTRVAIKGLDNREGTVLGGETGIVGFGMGAAGGRKTGRYYLLPLNRWGDGQRLVHLVKKTWSGSGWQVSDVGSTRYTSANDISSWAEPGQANPQAFKKITSDLEFVIQIAPASELDLSQEIAIDGSATMELVYL
ncbi:DUF1120 domain-containing protein [Pseudomonas aeruginosa]|uniref:DUF1120 domain-containing protein n=1 Tax=Pseudomonas aeruginosa TaxID=287 RepID=UPI001559937C|nr:DUF1120 domain-containing protein [Pseudomonas aeruginosa]NPW34281.1 DUF1120 domain-containing protein [Pseudomonas aeruginosa]